MAPGKTLGINIFSQFLALLYKELLLRKFHYVGTSFLIIFPILFASIPCIMYHKLNENNRGKRSEFKWLNYTIYPPKEVSDIYSYGTTDNLEFVYAPSNDITDQFMKQSIREFFGRYYTRNEEKIPKGLTSEEELRKYIDEEKKMDEGKEFIGTVFKGFGVPLPENLDYKIYYTNNFYTRKKFEINGPTTYNGYVFSFFLRWQAAVGETFIQKKLLSLNKQVDYKIFLQAFPYPRYKYNPLEINNSTDTGFYLYLGLICFAVAMVKRMIEEKNDGSKELMETMGMTKCTYWFSTFVRNFITAFIVLFILTIIYKTSLKNTFFHVHSEFMLLFFILLLFAVNLILFCMTFSIFFNRVAFAVIALMIIYLLPHHILMWKIHANPSFEDYFSLSLFHKLCICMYPGGALLTFSLIMLLFESGNVGVQWRNLTEYSTVPDINLLMVLAIMVLSSFLYIAAIWYFDTVWPWQPGVRKPFYFFFMKSYWFGERPAVPHEIEMVGSEHAVDNYENEPENAIKSVVIKNLSKVIPQGSSSKRVLHDVSMKCYQGQITVLLGHGEAGKTSLINILTGKELPTNGSASISGLDISSNTTRKFIGVCPQHNVLYDELSVDQHLKLYAAMKGISFRQLTYEAEQVLLSLKLSARKAEMVSNLSYTEKRKLSLAIAIVGGSKVLLLDEPTYGMDAEAKRHVWDALQAIKQDRAILVTTQSYEEADILGDSIAVMAEGEIQSCGTPAFVKQKLGAGYHLHVLKDVNFDLQGFKSLIGKHVSTVTCENESHKEISFNLGTVNELGDLFDELDSCKKDLGIISYGVSLSTIRDVLLTASNMSNTKNILPAGGATENTITETEDVSRDSFRRELHASLGGQFKALLIKHFQYCKRRWKFHIIQIAVPFFLMLMCFYYIKSSLTSPYQPLKLDISSVYGATDGFYHTRDPTLSHLVETFKNVLESNDVSVKKVSEPTHYVLNYGEKNLAKYLKRLVVGGAFDSLSSGFLNLTAWHNLGSLHSAPMSLLLMQTALLRYITDTGSMSLAIEPVIPIREHYGLSTLFANWWLVFFVPLTFTFLSLSFILVPTHEKATKAKLLQLMSGIPAAMYWIAVFIWDFLIYYIICNFLALIPAFFFSSVFFGTHMEAFGSFVFIFLLYGWASLPLGYIVSILIQRENRGLSVFIGSCLLFSLVSIAVMANLGPLLFLKNYEPPYGIEDAYWVFRLFPLFSISTGTQDNMQIAFHNAACDVFTIEERARCAAASAISSPTLFRCCKAICEKTGGKGLRSGGCHETMNYLSMKKYKNFYSNGYEALFLGLEGIVFFAVLFLLETRTASKFLNFIKLHLQRIWSQITRIVLRRGLQILREENIIDDPQVLQEEEKIRNLNATQQGSGGEALAVLGLTKKCGSFSAVNRLTFGVNGDECFGILGINGAGKTSTFRLLAGDDLPSSGNAFIQRYSLIGDFRKFRSQIGYCPKDDPLMDELSGRQMLLLFGQLRGLRGYDLQKNVNDMIQSLELTNCADQLTKFYSRGNQRKLSVAIAFIGSPPVILLDQPTAGVGPESQRQIWKALTRVQKKTRAAILLATQSIEESEALCNRLAVMVNGRFRCLGSVEQLRSKQGQGYVLTIKISKVQQHNTETVDALKNHMQNSLKGVTLTEDYQGKIQYFVVNPSMTVGSLFKFMSDVKAQFEIEDYSIGANLLEQIFLGCSRT